MKVSAVILALIAASGAEAYSVNRSTIRSLGQKSVVPKPTINRSNNGAASLKMEGTYLSTPLENSVAKS